jgi:hypothetical protein
VALRRLKTAASAVNEDVMAGVQTRFFREPPATPPAEVTGSGIVRVVKGYKELASVTDDFGRD